MASVIVGSGKKPAADITCPRLKDLLNTMMSSMCMRHCVPVNPASTQPIKCWNVAGALVSPKGIALNSKYPFGEENAVFSLSCS